MRQRIGFLKKAIARTDGYYSRSGERLVSAKLTQDEVDVFNTYLISKKPAAAPKKQETPAKSTAAKKTVNRTNKAPVVVDPVVVDLVVADAVVSEVIVETTAQE